MKLNGGYHLTYCSNIHPGETWEEVRHNLATYLPEVRGRLGLEGPFGVGLRLSARAAEALEAPKALQELREFLAGQDAYVYTLNGFPYGVFHRARVKADAYLPDWRDPERLAYTNRLGRILAGLLPEGIEGSISTVPGAYKGEVNGPDDERRMADHMLRCVAELYRLRRRTGRTLTLALEPEPCCYLETTPEVVAFFREHLHHPERVAGLAAELGLSPEAADRVVSELIGVCYDTCHMAVEFEEAAEAVQRLKAEGIRILKLQISSALKLAFRDGDGRPAETLSPFAESTYLHQVVERSGGEVCRYPDLPEALAAQRSAGGGGDSREWRVHFHVPIFLEEMRHFSTTQDQLVALFRYLKDDPVCPYLEVETYTWDVLPAEYKTQDTAGAIARELAWVKAQVEA